MKVSVAIDRWPLNAPFATSRERITHIETVTVTLDDGRHRGRGEALGVDYLGETPAELAEQVREVAADIEGNPDPGLDRITLQERLPPGGARNALDCALWDLECRRSGRRAWERAGIVARPVTTAYTLSLDDPAAMAREAQAHGAYRLLKLKLDRNDAAERLSAVRAARPDARLVVDANGGWDLAQLSSIADTLVSCGVELLEQPLPRGVDQALAGLDFPVPMGADESCQGLAELEAVANRYDVVNIKLDKCGGLTEALAMIERARALNLDLMVGNMLGSSLAMAPAFLVAQACRWVDLDGPLWQRKDRDHPIRYDGDRMHPPDPALWG
jgi:L-alanine-DL-glutamate epimerase-like enolase superfamily enzyme